MVKYALLGDQQFFSYLESRAEVALNQDLLDMEFFSYIIQHSCMMKADIVSKDEREGNMRALLNLGHTFGHALEKEAGYNDTLLHGEAVSIGMVMAAEFSAQMGLCTNADVARITIHLQRVGLPTKLADINMHISANDMLSHMMQDKKVKDRKLVLVLLHRIGKAFLAHDVEMDVLESYLQEVCE